MDLSRLSQSARDLEASYSPSTLEAFVDAIGEISVLLGQCSDPYLSKLSQLDSAGFFRVFNLLLTNLIDSDAQLKMLRLWDILVQGCSSNDEIQYLFKDSVTNALIQFPWDSSIDLFRCYATVLKGISLKLQYIDPDLLFWPGPASCPLYSSAVQLISMTDSVTISAARLVVLNLCMAKQEKIITFISEKTPDAPFEKLIDSTDSDRFVFLSDLFGVSPPALISQVLGILQSKLQQNNNDMTFISKAANALCDGPARTVIAEQISKNLPFMQLPQPVSLGLLLFAVTHKLIYLDAAIRSGLIPAHLVPQIRRFSDTIPHVKTGNFCEELFELLKQELSLAHTTVILRILDVVCRHVPDCVLELQNATVQRILADPARPLMEAFVRPREIRQRTDLDYLETYQPVPIENGDVDGLLSQLTEIQYSIGTWTGTSFVWYKFPEIEEPRDTFVLHDQSQITLSGSELFLETAKTVKLWRMRVAKIDKKAKKDVLVFHLPLGERANRPPNLFSQLTELRLTFAQSKEAANFYAKVVAHQNALVKRVLGGLAGARPRRDSESSTDSGAKA
jgi:hypothetical protein